LNLVSPSLYYSRMGTIRLDSWFINHLCDEN